MAVLKPSSGSYNSVPDKQPPIPLSIYDLLITEVTIEPNSKRDGDNLIVKTKIDTEGPQKGRSPGYYYLALPKESDTPEEAEKRHIRIKQFCGLACCLPEVEGGGYDTDMLKDRIFKGEVGPDTYTDSNGQVQESSKIKRIFRPDGTRI